VLKTENVANRRLNEHFAASLQREASALAMRWRTQGRVVAPGSPMPATEEDNPGDVMRAIDAIARSLVGDASWQDDLIRAGWAVGAEELRLGASLHALLRQLDLLEAMILYVVEVAAASPGAEGAVSDGVAAARRIQRGRSLLSLAALKGFTQAYLDDVRARYRLLRHDLRNPLGTIRTAVSLMEDESIPADMRANPRFRAMVKRNASTIDSMIGLRLSDETTHEEAFAWHDVSLADVARAVRRDLREDATEVGCEITVDESLPALRMDAMGVELALRAIISALLRAMAAHSTITIGPAVVAASKVVITVRFDAAIPGDVKAIDLALADQIAGRIAGRIWIDEAIHLELPISGAHEGEHVAGTHE
jgi:signal transduction histidine kinase